MDFIIDLIAHRISVFVLGLLSGGRFEGESGFAWGWAVVVGRRCQNGFPQSVQELYFMFPKAQYPLTEEQMHSAISQRLDSKVFSANGEFVGFANFYRAEHDGICCIGIGNVIVASYARGQGVARYIVDHDRRRLRKIPGQGSATLLLQRKHRRPAALPKTRLRAVLHQRTPGTKWWTIRPDQHDAPPTLTIPQSQWERDLSNAPMPGPATVGASLLAKTPARSPRIPTQPQSLWSEPARDNASPAATYLKPDTNPCGASLLAKASAQTTHQSPNCRLSFAATDLDLLQSLNRITTAV